MNNPLDSIEPVKGATFKDKDSCVLKQGSRNFGSNLSLKQYEAIKFKQSPKPSPFLKTDFLRPDSALQIH